MSPAAYMRHRRASAESLGACKICLKREAVTGRALCEPCRERNRARNRERYAAAVASGVCPDCGDAALHGFSCCEGCLDHRAERAALRRNYTRAMEAA